MSDFLLEMREISKSFPGVQALQRVSFCVRPAEIVCLLGENGAGKSTLMKILTGLHQPDAGKILLDGREVQFKGTQSAIAMGISVVSQEFNLCPNLSALENLYLGQELRSGLGLLSWPRMRAGAQTAFAQLQLAVDHDTPVRDLSVAQQQMLEIAKALSHHPRLLVLDEPTSTLASEGVQKLFTIMRELKARGLSVVFISHRLDEVLAITDRVVCLKDGQNSGEVPTAEANPDRLVSMMVGRNLDQMYAKRASKPGAETVLELRGFSRPPRVLDVSFGIRRGEILGMAGLVGAGRTEVARLIIGADRRSAGRLFLEGQEIFVDHPADAVAHQIGYVPEDRKRLGLIGSMSVRENTTMAIHAKIRNRLRLLRRTLENGVTDQYIQRLQTRVTSREQTARNLSGGNQQKVVLAKWLAIRPKVLILDEPTRGIDVGAKAEVHRIIGELADSGVAILLISSELPEVLRLADRVVVMHQGRLTAELSGAQATEEAVMRAAVN